MAIQTRSNRFERRFTPVGAASAGEYDLRADAGESRTVRGYAAVFNSLSVVLFDVFREKILPGAFRESIAERDIVALWGHDMNIPLARTSNGALTLEEDDRGLKTAIDLDTDQWGDFALRKVQRRDVKGMSFGFEVPPGGDEWDRDPNGLWIRTVKKVELYEVSPTAFPAYPDTTIAARSVLDTVERLERERGKVREGFSTSVARARLRLIQLADPKPL